jgi:hypothetical protein
MKWSSFVPALMAIGLVAVEPAHAQAPKDDYRRTLIQTFQLAKTDRAVIKRLSAAIPKTAPQMAACLDRVATDERLEAALMPLIARSIPTPESARPIVAFLATPAGRKFGAAVERRDPQFKPTLSRPLTLPGGVPMSATELTTDEARNIDEFFRSDQGAPLLALLKETSGFTQLIRALELRKTLGAECGIAVDAK